jgi:hypothetical protein
VLHHSLRSTEEELCWSEVGFAGTHGWMYASREGSDVNDWTHADIRAEHTTRQLQLREGVERCSEASQLPNGVSFLYCFVQVSACI